MFVLAVLCDLEVGAVQWCFLAMEGGGATEEGGNGGQRDWFFADYSRGKLHHHALPRPPLPKPVI